MPTILQLSPAQEITEALKTLTRGELAAKLDISENWLDKIVAGRQPSKKLLRKIIALRYEGERADVHSEVKAPRFSTFDRLVQLGRPGATVGDLTAISNELKELRAAVEALGSRARPLSEVDYPTPPTRDTSSVPVIDWEIAAGNPREINEKDIEYFAVVHKDFLKKGHAHIGLKVKGNSMEPAIRTGFVLFVDTDDKTPKTGSVVAFLRDGHNTIRRITEYKAGARLVLSPDNPEGGENETFTIDLTREKNPIVGRVVFWWGVPG